MCGISGIIYKKNQSINSSDIKRLNNSLSHRGPDSEGYYINNSEGISLGSRRLRITGFDKYSEQPFISDCNNYILLFNGEIYNYLEIRKDLIKNYNVKFFSNSDTEVVLNSYKIWGKECLNKFNGMWSIFIWNKKKKEAFISRDRFGEKPFFYIDNQNYFIFASELKAFKQIKNLVNIKINEKYLSLFSNIESSQATLIDPVKNLNAGTNIFIKNNLLRINEWWNLNNYIKKKTTSYVDVVEEYRSIFEDSVKLRTQNKKTISCSLSGGLDSSSIFYFLQKNRNALNISYIKGYHFKFHNNVEKNYNIIKKEFSDTFEEEKKSLTLENICDCIYSLEAIDNEPHYGPLYLYKKMKNDGIKFTIEGHGPDELLGGYEKDMKFFKNIKDKNILLLKNFFFKFNFKFFYYNQINFFRKIYLNKMINLNKKKKMLNQFHKDKFNDYLFNNFHNGSLRSILRNFDRLSMSNGIEVRSPFLDWRLVTMLFSLPSNYKIDVKFTKKLMRDSFKSILPNIITQDKLKTGFTSSVSNFKNNKILTDQIKDLINSKDFINFENTYKFRIDKKLEKVENQWRFIQGFILSKKII